MTNILLTVALAYAARGWRVLPLHTIAAEGKCSCGALCASPGKHPRYDSQLCPDGVKSATTAAGTIKRWWFKWPDANIGIATGAESGIVVLDVDPAHGGEDTLFDLELQHGKLPHTPESLTGGGGRHIIFEHPGQKIKNIVGQVGDGLDIRGDGGYIVAPPSNHASGHAYAWDVGAHPDDTKPAPVPHWLLQLIVAPPAKPGSWSTKQAGPIDERITEGKRNVQLMSLAGSLRRRGASEEVIMAALAAVNEKQCVPPMAAEEIERIAHSAARYQPAVTDRGAPAVIPGEIVAYPQTDLGNAEVIQALYGDRMRFDWLRGRWLLWSGRRWETDQDGELKRLAGLAARARLRAAANIEDEKQRKSAITWATGSENSNRLNAAIDLARSCPQIAEKGNTWDANPWLIGCSNGVLDLRTGALRAAEPGDKITLSTGIEFDPAALAPRFEKFLEEVFNGDGETIDFVQRAVGYSLTGDVREQCLFLCYGEGANGKSTLLNILRLMLGEYSANTPFSTFELGESRNSATNDIAALCGRRLVTAAETAEARQLNEARVKAITGGDPVTARFLHKEFFTYTPTYKVWLAVNHKPKVTGTDDGIWRRLKPIPFLVSFKGREDKTLGDALRAELPGILAWAVHGCIAWQTMGIQDPPTVAEAAAEYRNESDAIWQFLQDACILREGAMVGASELYQAFKRWCAANGEHEISGRQFSAEIAKRREITKDRRSCGMMYFGVGLIASQEHGVQTGWAA